MSTKGGYVYIMSNKERTTLYIGVTSNLIVRTDEHKSGMGSDFTIKYKCYDLIYYEFYDHIESAIEREKQLKKWNRVWKEELIKLLNPQLKDLLLQLMGAIEMSESILIYFYLNTKLEIPTFVQSR
jgi:putative endonuclease